MPVDLRGEVGRSGAKLGTMDSDVIEGQEGLGRQKLFCHVHRHSLDAKKRLTIPSDWRELVGEPKRIFILQGIGSQHLRALPAYEMARRLEKLQAMSLSDTVAQEHIRTLASQSALLPWDAQGRIRINDDLLAYAGITDEAVLVGSFNGFEIWSPESWKETQKTAQQAKLADAVRFIGL